MNRSWAEGSTQPPDNDRPGGASPAESSAAVPVHGKRPEQTRRHRMPAETARMLAESRRAAGLTLAAVGEMAGVQRAMICRLERAYRAPSAATAVGLASALGLDERARARLMEAARPAGRSSPWRTGEWL